MKGKKLRNLISLIISILIFGFIIWYIGPQSFVDIYHQIKPIYLIPYTIFVFLSLSALTGKLQFILKRHKQKIPFFKVLKYTIAGFAVSYLTPTARVGGEPIKTYMMKKECDVPLKIGGSSVIIDKFIELLGSIIIAIIGLSMLFLIPGITLKIELIIMAGISFFLLILGYVYILTIKKKGPFTKILTFLRFYRFKKFKKYQEPIKDIEKRMEEFFKNDKKSFLTGLLFYLFVALFGVLEFKFLLLALGLNASVLEIILFQMMLGLTNLLPVPAGLGFQEIGESGLFKLLNKGAGAGLFFSLAIRIRNLLITGIGFIIITHFGSNEISKKYLENEKK